MQLVAYGAQDIYLTGNPQITFFKVVYRRHTNFAMEAIEQTYSGQADYGKYFSVTISRNGDLVGRIYFDIDVTVNNPSAPSSLFSDNEAIEREYRRFGYQLFDYVEVEIGGQIIDKHYGEWMDIWCQLSHTSQDWQKLNRLINGTIVAKGSTPSSAKRKLYIPLQFWFNRNPGLYLPLIALQYHEVKLNVQFKNASQIGGYRTLTSSLISLDNVNIYCDYVFLDTDERRRFAQVSHEYLIEQVQYNNNYSTSLQRNQIQLNFNHPCKELVWLAQPTTNVGFDYFPNITEDVNTQGVNLNNSATGFFSLYDVTFFGPSSGTDSVEFDSVESALLVLNGQDRFKRRPGSYFRCVQPYQHHTGANEQSKAFSMGGFYVYSFGLKPEEHQPSGTCNFSRIDNTVLDLVLNPSNGSEVDSTTFNYNIRVYATNYNVLRIMSGMGGLAYSN